MEKSEYLEDDPVDREIDYSKLQRVPNPFANGEFRPLRNWVFLDPNVLQHFPDSDAVNAALRELIALRATTAKRSARTVTAPRPKK
jgi:hypothetical protein